MKQNTLHNSLTAMSKFQRSYPAAILRLAALLMTIGCLIITSTAMGANLRNSRQAHLSGSTRISGLNRSATRPAAKNFSPMPSSALAQTSSTSTFGFNYWPYGYNCNILNNANWTVANRRVVAADMDHIASLGGGVIRIMFWPQLSGFGIRANHGGGEFTSEFYEQTSHVASFIQLAQQRKLKVIVAFGNNWFDLGNGSNGHRWWMDSYSNFADFLGDTGTWINGFVNAIESSPYKGAVLYYDYENEYNRDNPYMGWYVTFLYDWSVVPAGKRGVSVLRVPADVDDLQYQLTVGGSRYLDYVDYHSYPSINHNPNIEGSYDYVKSKFPTSKVLLGEFGRSAGSAAEEAAQQTTVLDVANRARAKNIPYYLNWMLWDRTPGSDPTGAAWGYDMHRPKDVMGGMSKLLNLAENPDMEIQSGSAPAAWAAGGSVPFSFYGGGPATSDAATNQWYARIQVNQSSGLAWLSSNLIPVLGGRRTFANSYIRSNMSNVHMSMVQYDLNLNIIARSDAPSFTPSGWSFNNYLQVVGPWNVVLNTSTRYIIINVAANVVSNPAYLDVDTVSVYQR